MKNITTIKPPKKLRRRLAGVKKHGKRGITGTKNMSGMTNLTIKTQQQQKRRLATTTTTTTNKKKYYSSYSFKYDNSDDDTNNIISDPYTPRPQNIVEALYQSAKIVAISGLASAISFFGLPLFTAWHVLRINYDSYDQPLNWKSKTLRVVLSATVTGIVGGIISGVVLLGGSVLVLWNLFHGLISSPKIFWHTVVLQKSYWNATAGEWEQYDIRRHVQDLEDIKEGRSSSTTSKEDSLYRLLKVDTNASAKEIRQAYRKLAKEYHPDKNPDPESQAIFIQLRQAYETLYDPDSRRRYDQYGGKGGTTGMPDIGINVGVFFEVLLGFSPKVEQYVGDLAISSFSTWLVETATMFTVASQASSQEQQEMFQEYISSFFFDQKGRSIPSMRHELRQVDIALYLQSFTKPYVEAVPDDSSEAPINDSAFREVCRTEAMTLAESTPFPHFFLQNIGNSLYWESKDILGKIRRPIVTITHRSSLLRQTFMLYRDFQVEYTKQKKIMNINDDSDNEMFSEARKKTLQSLYSLPLLMKFVWELISMDISDTLRGACWKVIMDSRRISRRQRRRQARALRILGEEFSKLGETIMKNSTVPVCQNPSMNEGDASAESCRSESDDEVDLNDRIQVAMLMARTKVCLY